MKSDHKSGHEFGPGVLSFATEETYLRAADERDIRPQKAILTFVVANETYGIEIVNLREIIKLREMTEIPRAPYFILGVISVRGLIIPVIDLRLRLRLAVQPPTRTSRIFVIVRNGEPFGLLVDAVSGVVRFGEDEIEPPPSTLSGNDVSFISGIARYGGAKKERIVVLLSLDLVLNFDITARGTAVLPTSGSS